MKSFTRTKKPNYKERGEKWRNKVYVLLHHKKLRALAVKFTLTFSEEVSRNQRLFLFSWDFLVSIYAHNVCSLVGWGRISGGGPAADILQQAKLPLVSHTDCRKKYSIVDRNAHLCAGEGRAAASGGCNGDSGGPLACEMGGKWYLHGAVSFGRRNCPTTHFTVFARITSYKSWILNKIGD